MYKTENGGGMECFYSMPPSCLWDFALPLFYSGFVFLLAQAAEQEGHDLGAGTVVAGAESGVAGARGNTGLSSPQDRIGVVSVSRHAGEGMHAVMDNRLLPYIRLQPH